MPIRYLKSAWEKPYASSQIDASLSENINLAEKWQNPMPIYFLGWGPDYPYSTDYLFPMAMPVNTSNYPGSNDFTPHYFTQTGHPNQSMEMKSMIDEYSNGTITSNTAVALQWFHKMNEELVNLTFYVYLYQAYDSL